MLQNSSVISEALQKKADQITEVPKFFGTLEKNGKTEAGWQVRSTRSSNQFYIVRMTLDLDQLCLSFAFSCTCKAGQTGKPCTHALVVRREVTRRSREFFLMFLPDLAIQQQSDKPAPEITSDFLERINNQLQRRK